MSSPRAPPPSSPELPQEPRGTGTKKKGGGGRGGGATHLHLRPTCLFWGFLKRGASKTKKKEQKTTDRLRTKKTRTKKAIPKKHFLLEGAFCVGCGHATACRMWAPGAGCGVFLYELVSSDDPLCGVFAKHFFFFPTLFVFFQRTFF
jgi:hypothetical protein